MSLKKYTPSKRVKQRLVDMLAVDVPMWKISKVLELSENMLRRYYPDAFSKPMTSGRKPWEPSPEQIRQIELMAGMGIARKKIALVVGVHEDTLNAAVSDVIERSSVVMDMRVGANLYRMATGDPNAKNTALTAIWWSKARMGWQEQAKVEHTGANGGPIQTQIQIVLPSNGRDDSEASTIDGEVDEDLMIEGPEDGREEADDAQEERYSDEEQE